MTAAAATAGATGVVRADYGRSAQIFGSKDNEPAKCRGYHDCGKDDAAFFCCFALGAIVREKKDAAEPYRAQQQTRYEAYGAFSFTMSGVFSGPIGCRVGGS